MLEFESVFDDRFRNVFKKITSLSFDKSVKNNALYVIWGLILEIDKYELSWHEPFIHTDNTSFMGISWDIDTRSLNLNIDIEEQWWSRHWEEDDKTKTDFGEIDYNNLSIYWQWLTVPI